MLISEFFPNPAGKDPADEWIELFNESGSAQNLRGWTLKDASNKKFVFGDIIVSPRDYLLLNYETTKITLNNNGEKIFLYDPEGILVDKGEYVGNAPAGKSFSRKDGAFTVSEFPTPGKTNLLPKENQDTNSLASASRVAESQLFPAAHIFTGVFLSIVFALTFVILYKKLNLSPN